MKKNPRPGRDFRTDANGARAPFEGIRFAGAEGRLCVFGIAEACLRQSYTRSHDRDRQLRTQPP